MRRGRMAAILMVSSVQAAEANAGAADPSCFARALPAEIRTARLDDLKFLIGWVFDVAAVQRKLAAGDSIDRHSAI